MHLRPLSSFWGEAQIVHHDQDGVYLGHGWLYELAVLDKVRVSYSENGAKGNVTMESFNSRFKAENRLLFWEQEDLPSLKKVVAQRIRYYNHVRRHSALGNQSPIRYLKEKAKDPAEMLAEISPLSGSKKGGHVLGGEVSSDAGKKACDHDL